MATRTGPPTPLSRDPLSCTTQLAGRCPTATPLSPVHDVGFCHALSAFSKKKAAFRGAVPAGVGPYVGHGRRENRSAWVSQVGLRDPLPPALREQRPRRRAPPSQGCEGTPQERRESRGTRQPWAFWGHGRAEPGGWCGRGGDVSAVVSQGFDVRYQHVGGNSFRNLGSHPWIRSWSPPPGGIELFRGLGRPSHMGGPESRSQKSSWNAPPPPRSGRRVPGESRGPGGRGAGVRPAGSTSQAELDPRARSPEPGRQKQPRSV